MRLNPNPTSGKKREVKKRVKRVKTLPSMTKMSTRAASHDADDQSSRLKVRFFPETTALLRGEKITMLQFPAVAPKAPADLGMIRMAGTHDNRETD